MATEDFMATIQLWDENGIYVREVRRPVSQLSQFLDTVPDGWSWKVPPGKSA